MFEDTPIYSNNNMQLGVIRRCACCGESQFLQSVRRPAGICMDYSQQHRCATARELHDNIKRYLEFVEIARRAA